MPIILDKLDDQLNDAAQQAATVKTYSPKFFHKKLTGKGGQSAGQLSFRNNPPAIPKDRRSVHPYKEIDRLSTASNNQTTTFKIPVLPIKPGLKQDLKKFRIPDVMDMVKVGEGIGGEPLYVKLSVSGYTIEETVYNVSYTQGQTTKTEFIPAFILELYFVPDANEPMATNPGWLSGSSRINQYQCIQTNNPVEDWTEIKRRYTRAMTIDDVAFAEYMKDFEIFDSTCEQSGIWQSKMDTVMADVVDILVDTRPTDYLSSIKEQVRYIMTYNIPLDQYKNIYQHLQQKLPATQVNEICKENLNLLLSDTLNHLDSNKSQLVTFTQPNPSVPLPKHLQHLSPEQTAAVKSNEPLILVQAGAGTGKSTLILGRIDYLIACGVKPEDITVLSFTNAAADHITEKNPNVHSMTIARMIHEIYSNNFANHELSTLETLCNSLEIYFPADMHNYKSVAYQFDHYIRSMIKNEPNHFTDMNNFIEAHYDEVINILNTIKQTSLELEIIICYQKIDTFAEPATIQSKFLIIDEVQDNSIFEFVYTLKYIDKHKESMFIVGDCSQTLYEFRASNPRALNILEGSGTFATYQLNINYRSNQEILDMANVLLRNIEANQYANIQLKANSRRQITEQSFLEKVHFDYEYLQKIQDFHDALPSIVAKNVKPYIENCLKKGEQVAILAFTRNDIANMREILIHQFPNLNPETDIVSIVPDRMYNTTVMTKYICKYWSQIQFTGLQNIMQTISNDIDKKLPYITYNANSAKKAVSTMLYKWRTEEGPTVQNWIAQVTAGQMSQDDFFDLLKDNMIQYEIRNNAIKQALLSTKNQEAKQSGNVSNAKILLSTIHSAKGLEFDNVVVIYKDASQMEEDKKRMYYVAFTRAMKSEFILAYNNVISPKIEADYLTVLRELHAIAPAPNSPLNVRSKNRKIKI